ncbi:MAG TPA: hypothetical protein VJL84_05410 [Kiloniellales bacterium]|nr:hypothetical protein [Kiloniellales bacterium]
MKLKTLLPLLGGGLFITTAALATQTPVNLCDLYTRDLKQDMMLVGESHPGYDEAAWALIDSRTECMMDKQEEGVAVLIAGIEALGLPVRTYD